MRPGAAGAVVVFARAPQPGRVKTRLCPPFQPAEAAELYARLLDDALEVTAAFAERLDLAAIVSVVPGAACASVARRAPTSFRVVRQRGADLAARMDWAVREAAAAGFRRVLLRGSDSPLLGPDVAAAALAALEHADVAVSPDRDGGYSLIALRPPAPGLFAHAMSTPAVLADTLANARARGLRTELLEPGFDIDTAADLTLLADARTAAAERLCPRTFALLDASDFWRFSGG